MTYGMHIYIPTLHNTKWCYVSSFGISACKILDQRFLQRIRLKLFSTICLSIWNGLRGASPIIVYGHTFVNEHSSNSFIVNRSRCFLVQLSTFRLILASEEEFLVKFSRGNFVCFYKTFLEYFYVHVASLVSRNNKCKQARWISRN